MLTIQPRIVHKILSIVHSLMIHTPLQDRCPIKIGNRIRPSYLTSHMLKLICAELWLILNQTRFSFMSNKQSWILQHIDKLGSSGNKFNRISLDGGLFLLQFVIDFLLEFGNYFSA